MIGIRYSCKECGLHDIEVQVRFRESSEDVMAWMKGVVEVGLAADHADRSPHCSPDVLVDIKIPMPPGAEFIGGPVQQ